MSTTKKKSKGDKIPKPISIKREKVEEDRTPHPISHYIDDRLELVKQIFGTLKPKTIINLAPEFLKKNSLDEIEELCLNELLCISTKRLKSIIEGTRCPTDTESSDDSDVQHKEEHISLEEISSDSDIGGSEKRRAKKKKKQAAKKTTKNAENQSPEGQISVLELLELQARARAIRSQLAMEPITKIEVKSDDEEMNSNLASKPTGSEPARRKRKSNDQLRSKKETQTNGAKNGKDVPKQGGTEERVTKKIKLKRNYRQTTKSPEKESIAAAIEATAIEAPKKEQIKSRSGSPDVIPIQAEPETLLISDSTDDEAKTKTKQTPTKQNIAAVEAQPVEPPKKAENSEPEEGEVTDGTDEETAKQQTQEPEKPTETVVELEINASATTLSVVESTEVAAAEPVSETVAESNGQSTKAVEPAAASTIVDDDDQNDDVISIGGDLEHEMIEEMVKEELLPDIKAEVNQTLSAHEEEDNDVISLDTSEDERDKLQEVDSESWRTRYLKSSKVSQVLAASRLGKRVRDKIKNTKHAQKRGEGDKPATDEAAQQQFASKHEDGSVEQYQELLQHRQRKSSNSSKGDK